MSRNRALDFALDAALWSIASLGLWLFACNRLILHWSNSGLKTAAMLLLLLALLSASHLASSHARRALWRYIPMVIIVAFGAGEAHRAWLRSACRGHATELDSVQARWNTPVTTTALVLHHLVLPLPQAVGRLRIAHLTDLHISPSLPWSYYETLVERTNAEEPDIVLLTGDFVSRAEYVPLLRRWLALGLRARSGIYAVLGNHDYWAGASDSVRDALESANVQVLSGRCARLSRDPTSPVLLCGTEAPWGRDFAAPRVDEKDLVIALTHTPDNVYALRNRAHAAFAGHSHGGQLRMLGIGALLVPSVFGRRFEQGDFFVDGVELFVSAGVGADNPPLRLFCPPKILVVDIVAEPSTKTKPAP